MTLLVGLVIGLRGVSRADDSAALPNLALGRPASSSSVENDDHDAARANDGKPDTTWTADDEPEGAADWWQVDLGAAFDLDDVRITWPFEGMNYRYKVEGSADQKQWQLLGDQTRSTSRSQVQRLKVGPAAAVRYVRVTVTGFDSGCCAGLSEIEVFGRKKVRS